MRNASSAFLVDTNVLVYAYDPTDGAKRERAIAVLERLGAYQTAAISTQILGEFFVSVTRKIPWPLTEEEAERSVTNYTRSWVVYALTKPVVLEAVRGLRRHHLSYWDSLIWATARLNGVPSVLSEDFSDGDLLDGVQFLNPFAETFDLALLQAGPWTKKKVYTIGYGGRKPEELIARLVEKGVRMVVDVRLRPDRASMGAYTQAKSPEKGIQRLLATGGIEYLSLPELGNVFLNCEDWPERYRQLLERAGALLIEKLEGLSEPFCLICAERRASECHRKLIADHLSTRGCEIEHLE